MATSNGRSWASGGRRRIASFVVPRGEKDQAFEWLERGYQQRDGGPGYQVRPVAEVAAR